MQRVSSERNHGISVDLSANSEPTKLATVQPVMARAMPNTVASLCVLGSSILCRVVSGSARRTRGWIATF